jgi:hypothetical protein
LLSTVNERLVFISEILIDAERPFRGLSRPVAPCLNMPSKEEDKTSGSQDFQSATLVYSAKIFSGAALIWIERCSDIKVGKELCVSA